MALPPTVENLWITVGISRFSVGNQGSSRSLSIIRQGVGEVEAALSTEARWLPTYSPQVCIER
jgi:hypothetical protein